MFNSAKVARSRDTGGSFNREDLIEIKTETEFSEKRWKNQVQLHPTGDDVVCSIFRRGKKIEKLERLEGGKRD